MAQQPAIVAGDHGEAALDEIHDREAARRGFPGLVGELARAEQDLGDVAMAGAAHVTIHGLQHAAGALELLAGQPCVGRYGAAMQRAQQPRDGLDPTEAVEVERNHGDERLIGLHAGETQEREVLAVCERMVEVVAVLVDAFGRGDLSRQYADVRWQHGGRRDQDDDAGIFLRDPEQLGLFGVQ